MDVDESDDQNDLENNILYDLTTHAEWQLDGEIFTKGAKDRSGNVSSIGKLSSAAQRTVWTFLRTVGIPSQTARPCALPQPLIRLVNSQLAWNIAIGSEGKLIAILQEQHVEISKLKELLQCPGPKEGWNDEQSESSPQVQDTELRKHPAISLESKRDEYDTVIGRGSLPKDPYPQWREVAWSPDNTMVACSRSNGSVDVFDIVGTLLFTIAGETTENLAVDLSRAVACLIFTNFTPTTEWSANLLVVNYHGSLKSYHLNRETGFSLSHAFYFNQHYPRGISSIVYHATQNILYVGGGCSGMGDGPSTSAATNHGITAWRILSDYPFYKLITDYKEEVHQAQRRSSLWKKVDLAKLYSWRYDLQDGIFKLSLSPNGKHLTALHYSGKVSTWNVPSLTFRTEWNYEEQPGYDEHNPSFTDNPQRRKTMKDLITSRSLIDINWWSDDAIILARCTGAITISSKNTLKNLLGHSPEWFEPAPHITSVFDGGFLALECESRFLVKRHLLDEATDEYDDSDDEETMMTKAVRYSKTTLHYLTDMERFQPPKKVPKAHQALSIKTLIVEPLTTKGSIRKVQQILDFFRTVNRTYRLVCFKSTTPEELYKRKINNEEYGEALALAKTYGLDCDKVYQRQWRESPVSVASIQDYLVKTFIIKQSKISKRSWVLHECLERVPDNIDAMRELLQFGLNGTDIQALIMIGKGEDGGRFILCDPDDGLYEDMDEDEFDPQVHKRREERKKSHRLEKLKQVKFDSLTLEQKELCRVRYKLLQYMDRLKTYEYILGGERASSRFDCKFFEKFRSQNIGESAIQYAQKGDWNALHILFTYHGKDLLPNRLLILGNFPETLSPFEYRCILPEISDGEVYEWDQDSWRDEDWCELPVCRSIIDPVPVDHGAVLYEDRPDMLKYRENKLTPSLLTDWFDYRACEIEVMSRQVDNSLELIKLAIERGVQGLQELLDDLITMELLVYECDIDYSFTFKELRDMADYEKLELIMSRSTDEMYIKNLRRWLVTFLSRCERKQPGAYNNLLKDYIITTAKTDLYRCVKIFESSRQKEPSPVIKNPLDVMAFALEALYSSDRDDQLDEAFKILNSLPHTNYGQETKESMKLHHEISKLEKHLSVAKILEEYGLKKTLGYIKVSEDDPDEAENLLIKLTRYAGQRSPPLNEMEWMKLHVAVVNLQDKVYRCLSRELCHEIYTESVLCSSNISSIKLAANFIEKSKEETRQARDPNKVEYEKAVRLILSSSMEYFNSSTNLMDSCMDLARTCLNLVKDVSEEIQEELDLIASLSLLDDFGVSILPLQVRLSKDRLDLVKCSINNRPSAYKQSQKLLRLGHLLRVPGDTREERDGSVLTLIAEAAVKAGDFNFAMDNCRQLMESGYAQAWNVCIDLAELDTFTDLVAKVDLLSFSMAYCSTDMISPILQAKSLLETQLLYNNLSFDEDKKESQTVASSQSLSEDVVKQTRAILSSTKKTTANVLSTVTDVKWWQSTINKLKTTTQDTEVEYMKEENDAFLKQGCHPFYEGIIDNCYSNITEADYQNRKLSVQPDIEISENILRTAKLEEMLTEGEKCQPPNEVLLKLASSVIKKDTSLGLSYLLALSEKFEAEKCFEDMPRCSLTFQLALYYYALQIHTSLLSLSKPKLSNLYRAPPTTIMSRVIDHVSSRSKLDWPEEVLQLVEKMKSYKEMLEDLIQAQTLESLGRGIDVIRFTDDAEYKKETVLGLAMSVDEKVFKTAENLCLRYGLSSWEVYMTHIEFLFSDSGLNVQEIERRIKNLDLVVTLSTKPDEFLSRMCTYVHPILDGKDHMSLIYFFKLLGECGIKEFKNICDDASLKYLEGTSPVMHLKLLRKLSSSAKGLDYKHLMDTDHKPIEVIKPVLSTSNINILSKLASQIPDQKGGFLQASTIYSAWAVKVFWGEELPGKKPPESKQAWLHRYELCGEFIQKMIPANFLNFIEVIVFTTEARNKLETECRKDIIRRALKLSRGTKKKTDVTGDVNWEDVSRYLQQHLNHLDSFNNDVIISLLYDENSKDNKYAEMYDLCMGDEEKLKEFMVYLTLDGWSIESLDNLMSVVKIENMNTKKLIEEAVSHIIQELKRWSNKSDQKEKEIYKKSLMELQKITENITAHAENWGEIVTQDDIMDLLRPFCSDSSVAVQPRLDVLHELEKNFTMTEDDTVLLTLYRTEALVHASWDAIEISESDITSEKSREHLFKKLLSTSNSYTHFKALSDLLHIWPPSALVSTSNSSKNLWVQLMEHMLKSNDEASSKNIVIIMKELSKKFKLDSKCSKHIFQLLIDKNYKEDGVKFLLYSKSEDLIPLSVEQLSSMEESHDEELLRLILEKNLVTKIVSTKQYPVVIEYLLNNYCDGGFSIEKVCSELNDAGFQAEAGSLLLNSRSTQPLLQTFHGALNVLGKWLKK